MWQWIIEKSWELIKHLPEELTLRRRTLLGISLLLSSGGLVIGWTTSILNPALGLNHPILEELYAKRGLFYIKGEKLADGIHEMLNSNDPSALKIQELVILAKRPFEATKVAITFNKNMGAEDDAKVCMNTSFLGQELELYSTELVRDKGAFSVINTKTDGIDCRNIGMPDACKDFELDDGKWIEVSNFTAKRLFPDQYERKLLDSCEIAYARKTLK